MKYMTKILIKKKFNLEKLNIDYWKKIFQNNINC